MQDGRAASFFVLMLSGCYAMPLIWRTIAIYYVEMHENCKAVICNWQRPAPKNRLRCRMDTALRRIHPYYYLRLQAHSSAPFLRIFYAPALQFGVVTGLLARNEPFFDGILFSFVIFAILRRCPFRNVCRFMTIRNLWLFIMASNNGPFGRAPVFSATP